MYAQLVKEGMLFLKSLKKIILIIRSSKRVCERVNNLVLAYIEPDRFCPLLNLPDLVINNMLICTNELAVVKIKYV